MRTVKRKTLSLNVKKRKDLDGLCRAYTREKRYWLQRFGSWDCQSHLGRPRTLRDEIVKQKYQSPEGLQARQASRLQKYNLGKKKQHSFTQSLQTTLEREINTAINQIIEIKNPSILVTEDLRHAFSYNKSKKINRKLSNWVKGKIQDRIAFKALAEGFRHEQVNAAYGSQSCPYCEFVDHRNRKGDRFQCLHCKHEDASDRIAAMNYARRLGDPEIGRYTPYRQVKPILLERFHRRLETGQPVTVPGRTLETAVEVHPPPLSRRNVIAGREKSRKPGGQSESETKNKHILTCF